MSSALIAGVGGVGTTQAFLIVAAGLANVFIGLMLVVAILVYVGGMILWVSRLGTYPSPRDEAIQQLLLVPPLLGSIILLLAIVQYLQGHPGISTYIISTAIVLIVIWIALFLIRFHGSEGEE